MGMNVEELPVIHLHEIYSAIIFFPGRCWQCIRPIVAEEESWCQATVEEDIKVQLFQVLLLENSLVKIASNSCLVMKLEHSVLFMPFLLRGVAFWLANYWRMFCSYQRTLKFSV